MMVALAHVREGPENVKKRGAVMTDEKKAAIYVSHLLRVLAKRIEEKPELIREFDLDFSSILSPEKGNQGGEKLEELDAFSVYAEGGEEGLRGRLDGLDLYSLRRILNRHDFDPSQLAQKWKDRTRLIDLILKRVAARTNGKEEKP